MNNDKKTPGKRGPKPKPPEERLEQLTIRLKPRLKFALELLARARHVSMSNAAEWAIELGVDYFQLGPEDNQSLGHIAGRAWGPTEAGNPAWRREVSLLENAPALLTPEERARAELIAGSVEYRLAKDVIRRNVEHGFAVEAALKAEAEPPKSDPDHWGHFAFRKFVDQYEGPLGIMARAFRREGLDTNDWSIVELLGLQEKSESTPIELLAVMARHVGLNYRGMEN